MRILYCLIASIVLSQTGSADEVVDPFDALFDIITIRTAADGSTVIPEAETPQLWKDSRYLVTDGASGKLFDALKAFNSLSTDEIESYSPLQRAILQHHLWCVFDWTTIPADDNPVTPPEHNSLEAHLPPRELFDLQKLLASVIRRMALPEEDIQQLPSPFRTTLAASIYSPDVNSEDTLKPFLPTDLMDENGSWVCINKPDFPIPVTRHSEAVDYRSAFMLLLKLPGGRQKTLDYLAKLNAFRQPWLPGKQERSVNVPEHHDLFGLDLHANPGTPNFPVGTQVALVQQALLIDDSGELVLSPLVQNIQLRAYLNVSVDGRLNNALSGPAQAVAEFVLQPRLMMQGKTPMRAVGSGERRHTVTFTHSDPIEYPRANNERHAPRLRSCMACHSGAGIHSINSRVQLFQRSSVLPPRLTASTAAAIGTATVLKKRQTYSWGLLHGLLRVR